MNIPFSSSLRLAGAMLALGLWSTLAVAGTDMQRPRAKIVSYSDLNLSTAEGVAAAYRRIRGAATEVCGPAQPPGTLIPRPAYRECAARAVAEAVAKVARPELNAYHAQRKDSVT